ncbi:hypothetical protein B0T10DRAFT_575171 [Thelonectria olida]|uniref:Uncharacterized protein n=1 Tax=Thelonectria olida TaxID=1576542 RepID=A0A9P8W423_9HYPO|nr:hypothetical protein B0T10DRAFT_575171 [Thelonectria olida]
MGYASSKKPTRVIQNKTSRWWTSLVHVVPIGLTAVLLWLSYSCKFWFPETGLHNRYVSAKAKNILNWLQLAAKLYEIVVVASMGAITLKVFKRAFVDTGVPLGILSGAYRVGDVPFLLNEGFWRALLLGCWKNVKTIALAALFIATTLLSLLVGPASAILIVPQLDWFPLPGAFSNTTLPLFYKGNNSIIWPTFLNDSLWPTKEEEGLHYCRLERGSVMYDCPAGGYANVYTWLDGWEFSGLPDNITFEDPSGTVSRRLDIYPNGENGTFITTPTALTAKTMGQLKHYIQSKPLRKLGAISDTHRWKLQYDLSKNQSMANLQPLVQAKCNIGNISLTKINSTRNITFPSDSLRCFHDNDDCHRIRKQLRKMEIPDTFSSFPEDISYGVATTDIWMKSLFNESTTSSTLMFAAGLPYAMDSTLAGLHLLSCSYMAHWISSIPEIDPSNTDYIKTNTTSLMNYLAHNIEDKGNEEPYIGSTINLQKSWLPFFDLSMAEDDGKTRDEENRNALALKTVTNDSYTIGSLLSTIGFISGLKGNVYFGLGVDADNNTDQDGVRQAIEKFTGSLLADAIARTAANTPALLIVSASSENVTLDQLFRQKGPNSFDYTLDKNGTAYPYDILHMKWDSLEGLKNVISETLVTVDLKAQQYGYGFGQPGPPRTFARTVITTYIAILLLYWVLMLAFSHRTVAPWNDVQDLLTLAWVSAPPQELKGQGACIENKGLWKEFVSARARRDDNYVSLVVGDDSGLVRLEKNGEYY